LPQLLSAPSREQHPDPAPTLGKQLAIGNRRDKTTTRQDKTTQRQDKTTKRQGKATQRDRTQVTDKRAAPSRFKARHSNNRRRRDDDDDDTSEYDDASDDAGDEDDDDSGDRVSETEKDNSSKTRTDKKTKSVATVIPLSQVARNYQLPPGVRRVTYAELQPLFDGKVWEFVLFSTVTKSHVRSCAVSERRLYYNSAFLRLVRCLACQRMKLEVPELKLFHHLKRVPEEARQLILNVNTCSMSYVNSYAGKAILIRLAYWCRDCQVPHSKQFQAATVIGLALARNAEESAYWMDNSKAVSHLCHWKHCGNVTHIAKETISSTTPGTHAFTNLSYY
jgi:hypothetical protein